MSATTMSPRRARLLSILVLAATLVVGCLIGIAVERLRTQRNASAEPFSARAFPPPRGPAGPMRAELIRRLDLTPEQLAQIDSIMTRRRTESEAILREFKPRLDAHFEATQSDLRAVLTPAQQVQFDQIREERRQEMARRFRMRPPPAGGARP